MTNSLPKVARLSRWLESAWARGLSTRPTLEPDAIVGAASAREGEVPGDGEWSERLALLCEELESSAKLNPLGRTIAFGQLVRLVRCRIRAERLWREVKEVPVRQLQPPVIIVGHMRSGTTRVHRLLACDPAFAHTRLFESLEPVPPRSGPDLRTATAWAVNKLVTRCNPTLAAIHPTTPYAPEEEFGLHAASFWGAQFEGQWFVPGFARHCEQADAGVVYREFAHMLRIIGWARKEPAGKPWLLKAPQFTQDLPALRAEFPGARFIVLKRSLETVVGSSASLAYQQARIQSDHADPRAIGSEWLRKTEVREEKMRRFFANYDKSVVELDYDDVSSDWFAAIERVYEVLEMELSGATKARMERTMRRSTRHRGHQYKLEDFGLNRDTVLGAFAGSDKEIGKREKRHCDDGKEIESA